MLQNYAKYKKWLILHILTKKNCAYIQKCYSNRLYMHNYCNFAFNILLFVDYKKK